MSDSFSSTSFDNNDKQKGIESELQDLLETEKTQMEFNSKLHEFNSICWDVCVDRPSPKLESKTEKCLKNCVDRFIDTSLFITTRYAQMLQKSL
ncbi:mitochondrial import inner membrane translocase subunit Tim8 [Leptopilina boulardi]|uniref:mitochondrial import inner membrane translocase subunit Tim8 n=1 Tax=Leptopilina boulardi TaxID=63433 RepID=UPI0021F64D30|nr:mitochondrial import inner membrane translocase subunit Tim8 [Leptopilina boulardi]